MSATDCSPALVKVKVKVKLKVEAYVGQGLQSATMACFKVGRLIGSRSRLGSGLGSGRIRVRVKTMSKLALCQA